MDWNLFYATLALALTCYALGWASNSFARWWQAKIDKRKQQNHNERDK